MYRREEEETKYGERRRNQSKENERMGMFFELIPLDLIPDILLRLPAKSAVRFRVVSKLWSTITTCPAFIRSFSFQSSIRLCLLACVKTRDKRLFISLPQHVDEASYSQSHVDRCQIKYPEVIDGYYYPCSKSVQGLVCFGHSNRIVVWNPSMRQHVTLPEPVPIAKFVSSCLGYDPVEDKYKVLCIPVRHRQQDRPFVFTLGPQESWRLAKNSPLHIPMGLSICINGHVYYQAEISFKVDDTFEFENILMSFDVRYEKFNTMKIPADPPTLSNFMVNYQGKLAWVCSGFSSLRFWVLEDVNKQEWSLRNFILPFPGFPERDPIFQCRLELKGVTHTGEFIFIATKFEVFYVLYYDPERKRARRIIYDGVGDEEFWISNGILDQNYSHIDWFPNHGESLISLENVPCLATA